MKSRSVHHFWLTLLCVTGLAVHWTEAGEKIVFSTNKKADDTKPNSLAIPQAKPALPTLDFSKMGGRPSKAEELAQQMQPAQGGNNELADPEEKKKDKDWLSSTQDKDEQDKDRRDGKNRDKDKQKNRDRDKNDRLDGRDEKDPNDPNRRDYGDPYGRNRERDPFNRTRGYSGGNTNRLQFGSGYQRDNQPFQQARPQGMPDRFMGLPPGARPNPFGEQDRTSALERLGLVKPETGNASANGNNGNSGVFGLGEFQNNRQSGNSASFGPAGSSATFRDNNSRTMNSPGSSFKTDLPGQSGPAGLGPMMPAKPYEPAKVERKPAILPVPQRKF